MVRAWVRYPFLPSIPKISDVRIRSGGNQLWKEGQNKTGKNSYHKVL